MKIDKGDLALTLTMIASFLTIVLFSINIRKAVIEEKDEKNK